MRNVIVRGAPGPMNGMVIVVLLGGCGVQAPYGTTADMTPASTNNTYVLVHGGWHGPWAWDRLRPLLEAAGDRVVTPTLPAHGGDMTPVAQATLDRYTQVVVDVVDAAAQPVVLVGHSMSGAVVSQVAEARPERVRLLVYTAAVLLEDGQSVVTITGNDTESSLGKNVDFQANGTLMIKPAAVREALYADCSDADAMWAAAQLGVEPIGPLVKGIHVTPERWGKVRRAYITTMQDKAIGPTRQTEMYTKLPCEKVVPMDTSHSPFICKPADFARVLSDLAKP